jgi:hypothetical protein
MAPEKSEDTLHKSPCAWMQVMIWAFGTLLVMGGIAIGHVMSRLSAVETRVNSDHTLTIETSTELKYIKAGVDKLVERQEKNQDLTIRSNTEAANAAAAAANAASQAAQAATAAVNALLKKP